MATIVIPTVHDGLGCYTQRTQFEGKEYLLRFLYHQRFGRWYLDVYDQDEVPIVYGLRLVVNFPIGRFVTDERWPPGRLVVVDTEAPGDTLAESNVNARDPGLYDLGGRHKLCYIEAADLA